MPNRTLKIVRLKKPKVADNTRFIETLVWVLDLARQGKVLGYAMVFDIRNGDERSLIEAASITPDDGDKHAMLGMIRRMEANFIRREWED